MKPAKPTRIDARGQRGIALFLILLLILVSGGLVFVSRLKSAETELTASRKTAAVLAEAKQALLGYAALDPGGNVTNPGRLPCPDQDNDGDAQGAVCASPAVGWLPWRTLTLDERRDGQGEKPWLLVDPLFLSSNAPMNSTVQPVLLLNGQPVVAILFAPGPPLSRLGQTRSANPIGLTNGFYGNYLEGFGASGVTTAPFSDTYNDRVLAITPRELFTVVTQRMARELALSNPGPYTPAPPGEPPLSQLTKPSVWTDNNWDDAVDAAYTVVTPSLIRLKFQNCEIIFSIHPGGIQRSANTC